VVKIGTPASPSFDEPLEMLAACHERIEERLSTLERLCGHLERNGNDADARAAAESILRYFDTSGRLHHEDEDRDLFPLLRVRAGQASRLEISSAMEDLEREHRTMEGEWGRLRAALVAIAGGAAKLDAEDAARFAALYRRHIERETGAVLPFAKSVLTIDERRALGRRMAARRKSAR
jgi:hemerythrin-like domain-containing protein